MRRSAAKRPSRLASSRWTERFATTSSWWPARATAASTSSTWRRGRLCIASLPGSVAKRWDFSDRNSHPRNIHRPHFAGLGRQPDRGVGGAEAGIMAALHDLEEKPLIENVGVDLEKFAVAFAVVQDLVVA